LHLSTHRPLFASYQWIAIPFSGIEPFEVYRVKKGDTLIDIARQFKASIGSIVVINHIWQPANLKAGSYILILSNRKEI
jgi:LysM repeat protein